AVQQFLHQAVRAAASCPGNPVRHVVEIDAAADEVDWHLLPEMRDRIALVMYFNGFGDGQAAIAQFREQRQQPALSRERRSRLFFWEPISGGFENGPRAQ